MATALPTHPTLVHPHTGRPLRAVFVSPSTGRVFWPVLGAEDNPPPEPPTPPAPPTPTPPDPGFPTGTPVAEMTAEQQAAYWKHQSRKHEDRAKTFGNLTADELTALREKAARHDALEEELASDAEKAAAEAKRTAQAEADGKYRPMLAETAFRVAIGDRKTAEEIDEFIGDLNLTRFLTDDGKVDTAKVLARVAQFAPATGTPQQQRPGPSPSGQGGGTGRAGTDRNSLTAGREAYRSRYRTADRANT